MKVYLLLFLLVFPSCLFAQTLVNREYITVHEFAENPLYHDVVDKDKRVTASFSFINEVNIERIHYLSDGLKVMGYIISPAQQHSDMKWPGIIYNRGGNNGIDREASSINLRSIIMAAFLSAKGYVVIMSNYRGGIGSEGKDEFGGEDLNDVFNLLPILHGQAHVDNTRTGMYGLSRGTMMSLMSLKKGLPINCLVSIATVADLVQLVEQRPELESKVIAKLVPDYATNKAQVLKERSAIYWPDELPEQTPIRFIHGDADKRAPYQNVLALNDLLKDRVPVDLITFKGVTHAFNNRMLSVMIYTLEWFDRYLKETPQK